MAADITVVGLGLWVSVVLARGLGPDGRGVYAWLTTTNLLLTNLGSLSVTGACSTFLARGRYRPGEINTVAMFFALLFGLLCAAAALGAYYLFSDSLFRGISPAYLLVALLLTPVTIYLDYWRSMMMGLSNIVLLNKLNLATNITSTVLMTVVVLLLGLGIPGFLGVWAFSALAGAAGALVLSGNAERPTWPPNREVARAMFSFGLRSHGANIAHYLFLRFDAYAVNTLVGRRGLGLYSLSTSLGEKMWLPLNAMLASSVGKVTQLPHEESALLTAKVARTALLMMLALALPFAIVSPWLIPFLYGPDFAESVLPLDILLIGTLGFAVMMVMNSYIVGQMERPGLLSIISWLELAISIPLYIVLIQIYGIVGAAIASTITYLIAMAATLLVFVRDSHLSVFAVLVPNAADFRDYLRILRAGLRRVPLPGRYTGQPS